MIQLFINALAASAGGGLTYLRNVIPQIGARSDVEATIILSASIRDEFAKFSNISFLKAREQRAAWRFGWEQLFLPGLIRKSEADVLISTGNFALWRSPVPQVLLSRNALYASDDFCRDLLARREYAMWMDTRVKGLVAKHSVRWADAAVAPTEAFAESLRCWTGGKVRAIPHGFERETFFGSSVPLPAEAQEKLDGAGNCLRLLFVSHYNYYRNFETLFRALPLIQESVRRPVKLFLTCRLDAEHGLGSYRSEQARALVEHLGISDVVTALGAISYRSLHHLYRACDVYVTPAYAESFAHPLVEAMSSGLPVVASDIAVHREICAAAALYFNYRSPQQLADRVAQVAGSGLLREKLAGRGRSRSQDFSWKKHVAALVEVAGALAGKTAGLEKLGPIPAAV